MTHSVCVPSPILNGSCKAASPRCEPAVSGESRCFDADDELRLGPKCGTLGASGSLRRTFTTSASSVAGAARGLSGFLWFFARYVFSSASKVAGVACGSLATPGSLLTTFSPSASKVAGPSSSSTSKIRAR